LHVPILKENLSRPSPIWNYSNLAHNAWRDKGDGATLVAQTAIIKGCLAGWSGSAAVLAARAALASRATGTGDSLVHDPADGARATPALGAATKTAINLAGGARRSLSRERGPNVVVGQHVARADDHGNPAVPARLVLYATIDT
jgi:hypothetical protein